MTSSESTHREPAAWIVYDGDCPFCTRYARLVRLRESLGPLALVDARKGGPLVAEVRAAGLDLDEGMVLKLDGRLHHGAEALNLIALLSSPWGGFNRINRALFRSARMARLAYPALRAGRNAALRLLGRKKIGQTTPSTYRNT